MRRLYYQWVLMGTYTPACLGSNSSEDMKVTSWKKVSWLDRIVWYLWGACHPGTWVGPQGVERDTICQLFPGPTSPLVSHLPQFWCYFACFWRRQSLGLGVTRLASLAAAPPEAPDIFFYFNILGFTFLEVIEQETDECYIYEWSCTQNQRSLVNKLVSVILNYCSL